MVETIFGVSWDGLRVLNPDPPNRIADGLTKPGQVDREPLMAANASSTGRATVEGSLKGAHGVSPTG